MKRSSFPNQMFAARKTQPANIPLRQLLFEPLYVVAACLMWGAILPGASLFCAGVDVYDKVTSPHWA